MACWCRQCCGAHSRPTALGRWRRRGSAGAAGTAASRPGTACPRAKRRLPLCASSALLVRSRSLRVEVEGLVKIFVGPVLGDVHQHPVLRLGHRLLWLVAALLRQSVEAGGRRDAVGKGVLGHVYSVIL